MHPLQSEAMDRLFQSILQLESVEECYRFFDDLCTIKELQDLAQRLEVAVLLSKGVNYQTISQTVNVSTATISRVSKCLNYGSGGYITVLERMGKEQEDG